MSAAAETPAADAGAPAKPEPAHGWRLFTIWLVLALAADLLIWFFLYPHLPPGAMSSSARHQQFDIAVLMISAAPVVIAVLLYFSYAIVVWRARPGDDGDGAPIYGHTGVQATWIIGTSAIVLWLFVFGTVEFPGGISGPTKIATIGVRITLATIQRIRKRRL